MREGKQASERKSQLLDAYSLLTAAASDADDDDDGVGRPPRNGQRQRWCPTEGTGPLIAVGEFQDASGNDDDDTAAPAGLRSAVSAGPRASGSHGFDSRACPFRASVQSLHFLRRRAGAWELGSLKRGILGRYHRYTTVLHVRRGAWVGEALPCVGFYQRHTHDYRDMHLIVAVIVWDTCSALLN